jgi:Spy/CpxP family protein refolding chaperone
MKPRNIHYLVLAAAICIASRPILAAAASSDPMRALTAFRPELIAKHREALAITPEQEAKLHDLLQEHQGKAEGYEKVLRSEAEKLGAVLSSTDDADAAAEQLRKLLEAEASIKVVHLRALISVRSVLNQTQREKALSLASAHDETASAFEARVREKIARLHEAASGLRGMMPPAISKRGEEVGQLIRAMRFSDAEAAIDRLIRDTGLNDTAPVEVPEFSKESMGNVELEELKGRLKAVEEKAKTVIHLPTLRQLVAAKEAIDEAKNAQDAIQIGKILTWAERILSTPALPPHGSDTEK